MIRIPVFLKRKKGEKNTTGNPSITAFRPMRSTAMLLAGNLLTTIRARPETSYATPQFPFTYIYKFFSAADRV